VWSIAGVEGQLRVSPDAGRALVHGCVEVPGVLAGFNGGPLRMPTRA